jgi:hypothetical protein
MVVQKRKKDALKEKTDCPENSRKKQLNGSLFSKGLSNLLNRVNHLGRGSSKRETIQGILNKNNKLLDSKG